MFYICTMKVRLLKRARKEFTINHYPNGCEKPVPGYLRTAIIRRFGPDTFTLENSNREVLFYYDSSKEHFLDTQQQIYDRLYKEMMKRILEKYAKYGTRRLTKEKVQQTPNKLWYNQ